MPLNIAIILAAEHRDVRKEGVFGRPELPWCVSATMALRVQRGKYAVLPFAKQPALTVSTSHILQLHIASMISGDELLGRFKKSIFSAKIGDTFTTLTSEPVKSRFKPSDACQSR
ncbi:MAG: hypothetical protein H7240_09305 [Glaciimonas sp.]|nr:hypothetical protein [Glaciimonas sp.]